MMRKEYDFSKGKKNPYAEEMIKLAERLAKEYENNPAMTVQDVINELRLQAEGETIDAVLPSCKDCIYKRGQMCISIIGKNFFEEVSDDDYCEEFTDNRKKQDNKL